ncbi:site-specific DNA-methyltransferase [Cellulophaga tyrosinoxydans]|uniref:site-specific DNA-methyltransferase (adenine-specific) n=1 Tax=Cellulophaga tyrosinoxydans TaxID=504486 RepID=A0A1W2BQN5_9FLAO|nr:site-specific DNA-methyltransferase [Cellulophaga tyrosinoxydans]SMC74932.1 adenine-specific DNA-methyltransferase [Cellulophaga tyrosinoxydans]
MNSYEHLKSILKKNSNYINNDAIKTNALIQAVNDLDVKLLGLLLSSSILKKQFFKKVDAILVFDKIEFIKFIEEHENELMLNDSAFINWAHYSKKGVTTPKSLKNENFIIKGDNYQVLQAIKPKFKGKIKCIYIDPPYNTGNESFSYKDKYASSLWLKQIEKCLKIAHELLTPDGVLFVSCDDNEFAYLKVLLDTIFKRENFIEHFSWKKTDTPSNLPKKSKKVLEYILCYEKSKDAVKYKGVPKTSRSSNGLMNQTNAVKTLVFPKNKIDTALPNGTYKKGSYGTKSYAIELLEDTEVKKGVFIKPVKLKGKFKWSQKNLDKELAKGTKVSIRSIAFSTSYEKAAYEVEAPLNYIDSKMGVDTTENAGRELSQLFGKEVFTYPKSESLIAYLLHMISNKLSKDDYVLDFYLGSGTTAAVAHKLGYKYIGIEHMDYIKEIPVKRLIKVLEGEQTGISKANNWNGGGTFVYAEFTSDTMKVTKTDAEITTIFYADSQLLNGE